MRTLKPDWAVEEGVRGNSELLPLLSPFLSPFEHLQALGWERTGRPHTHILSLPLSLSHTHTLAILCAHKEHSCSRNEDPTGNILGLTITGALEAGGHSEEAPTQEARRSEWE